MRFVGRGLLAFLGAAALSNAGDVESLHIGNMAIELKRGWTLQLHSRLRTNHNISDLYQVRGGAIMQLQALPRLAGIAGYYYIEQEDSAGHLFGVQRGFGGAQMRVWENQKAAVDARVLGERFFAGPGDDYTRGRWRLGASSKRRSAAPFVSGEALRAQGVWTGRFAGGLQWTRRDGSQLATGYEHRQHPAGAASHVLFTVVQWQARTAQRAERR